MTLTAVSLFAGIGGFDLALQRAGARVVAAVEIDQAARGVLADRFSDVALFEDVREVTGDQLRAAGFVPGRGILAAGWPCQDLSVAGRREGLGGARSGLFWQVVRLSAELQPRWLVLENVPGLLSAVCPGDPADTPGQSTLDGEPDGLTRGRGACPGGCMDAHGGAMGLVVGSLADLGYGLAWRVLDAQYTGVPQRRRRVFFVGRLGNGAAPVEVLLESDGGRGDSAAGGPQGAGVAAVAALGASDGGADDNDATGGRLIVGPLQAQGSGGRGHRLDAEGTASGHLVAAPLRAGNHHGDQVAAESHLVVPTLTAGMGSNVGHPGSAGKDEMVLAVAATLTAGSHDSKMPGRRREDDENVVVVVGTVSAKWAKGTGGPSGDEAQNLIAFDTAQITHPENRVNPKPGDPAMPLAASGQPHVAYTVRADPGGSGQGHNTTYVTAFDWQTDGTDRTRPNVSTSRTSSLQTAKRDAVAYIVDKERGLSNADGITVKPTDVASTITAGDPAEQTDRGLRIATETAVRRLTAVECERLQGFPDGWTATSNGKPQADSPRYRQLGNSVAVPVVEWIARRLVAVDEGLGGGGA